ncbi:unnamed protein product [Urochloa decumbens]|uniref:BURP domain-containing protein n=1 Tax=Urochloa decumbens TaxID=240449 RepID=A0ABC9ARC0_9POAL
MGVLLFLVPLVVAMAGGDRCAALVPQAEGATVPYYASASELNSYWQSVFPNQAMPSAILDHLSAPSGNEKKVKESEHYWSVYLDQLTKGDAKIFHNWAHRIASEKLLYPESVFTVGSKINLYIDRGAALHSAWLRHDTADSIPMSTKNFTEIVMTFAPVSLAMAHDMWSTLSSCEHPREVAGEQKACTMSVESMHGFAASTLGTNDLRAISTSVDVPEDGINSPSNRYKVAAVRAVTAKAAANTITCHSMSFPVALFYCHAVNPTRIYEVTLQRDREDNDVPVLKTPPVVRAIAVCHVNTSGFDPTLKYWVKLGRKPGQASVCHFLTRGDVLWVPASAA